MMMYDLLFSLLFLCGLGLVVYVVRHMSPDKEKVAKTLEEERKAQRDARIMGHVLVKNENVEMEVPLTLFALFGLLVLTLAFKGYVSSSDAAGLHEQSASVDSLLRNLPVLGAVALMCAPFLYYTYHYYSSESGTGGKDPRNAGFLLEGFVFAFLTAVGDNMALFIEGEKATASSFLASFLLFFGIHAFFEKMGFNKWFFPVDSDVPKKCPTYLEKGQELAVVDLKGCTSAVPIDHEEEVESVHRGYQYFAVFLCTIVFMVFVLPAVKYFQDRKDFKQPDAINALAASLVIAILTNVAMQFMYKRRNDRFMDDLEMMLVGGKFMIHHFLWNITRIDRLLSF